MKIVILSPDKDLSFVDGLKKQLGGAVSVVVKTKPQPINEIVELKDSEEKILALDPDFVGWKFSKEAIDSISNLKAICLQTTSFSYLDVVYAATKNIPVTNLRGFSAEAVAEFALMMMIGVARKLSIVIKDGYKQDFVKHQGIELKSRRVGVIGLGTIGKRFAELCQGIGMEIAYWSKSARDARFKFVELVELMKTSDVIFPAMAKNEESKEIITDAMLHALKSSAIFVSISHGIYNHDLVLELAKQGKIFGYAFEDDDENLAKYEGNVFALPSIAWATDKSRSSNRQMWADSIVAAAKGKFPNRVNLK